MLQSFTYILNSTVDQSLQCRVYNEIQKLRRYFYKFCRNKADECMEYVYFIVLENYSEAKGELTPYIKKLARESVKYVTHRREICTEFLEDSVVEDDLAFEGVNNKVSYGSVNDFSNNLLRNIIIDQNKRSYIIRDLVLSYPSKFIQLCESFINHDSSLIYYPDSFKKQCLNLAKGCDSFKDICLSIYNDYKDLLLEFNIDECAEEDNKYWRQYSKNIIDRDSSKRICLVNPKTKKIVENPDYENFIINGSIGNKRVIKVHYANAWETMCDMVDSDTTNAIKLVIEDSYIIKTLAGSVSLVNADVYNYYDIFRGEILTNILSRVNAKVIGIGSENFYLLVDKNVEINIEPLWVNGVYLDFFYEDLSKVA